MRDAKKTLESERSGKTSYMKPTVNCRSDTRFLGMLHKH